MQYIYFICYTVYRAAYIFVIVAFCVCMYIYVYIHVCMHVCMYVYIYNIFDLYLSVFLRSTVSV